MKRMGRPGWQEWADKQSESDMLDRVHWNLQSKGDTSHTGNYSDECKQCQRYGKKTISQQIKGFFKK